MLKVFIGIVLGYTIGTAILFAEREKSSDPSEGVPCICPPEDDKPGKQL
jgi:hypothetical protein